MESQSSATPPPSHDHARDIAMIGRIGAVPTILDVVCRTTGMRFAAVARVTDERWIACGVKDSIQFGLAIGDELKLETTICNEIRQSHRPVVIDHVERDELFREHPTPAMYRFQSYISMPIVLSGGRLFGTLCAIDPEPARVNTPEVIGMFQLFSELIAFHIDAEERVEEAESMLSAERETSELREQFIAVLGHDLRTPLSAISAGASMLKEIDADPRISTIAKLMESSVSRMSDMIEDVMDFARGRLGGGMVLDRRADVAVERVLHQVIEEMKTIWPGRAIEARIHVMGTLDHDPRRLGQLFANLIGNAFKHGKPDQPVKVEATNEGGRFTLSVSNAAEPIPPTILSRLFQPFFRGDPDKHQQGLGLGLYIASEIAKAHGGRLDAHSSPEETRFTFALEPENR